MKTRVLVAALYILYTLPATAQVSAQYSLDDSTFAPGQPIFLNIKITNTGDSPQTIRTAIPDQPFCSDAYIDVSSDPPRNSTCQVFQGCAWNGGLMPTTTLYTGQFYIARYLLNFGHEINAPGEYWVEAQYRAHHLSNGNVGTRTSFRVDAKLQPWSAAQYQPLLDQLKSDAPGQREDAARTLASLAPRSLESTLLDFANHADIRRYAPLAFHRLNTPASMQALGDLIKTAPPGSFNQLEASQYLAESGDQQWYPLLLDAAVKNGRISGYPDYAAELGGDKILPILADLAKSPDQEFTGRNALMAMGSSGSRAAIPILLDYLKSSNIDISDNAGSALQQLTHRTATTDFQNRNREAEALKWSRWWTSEGATAPIYKPSQCGEIVLLP